MFISLITKSQNTSKLRAFSLAYLHILDNKQGMSDVY